MMYGKTNGGQGIRSKVKTARFYGFSNVQGVKKDSLQAVDAKHCNCKNSVLTLGLGGELYKNDADHYISPSSGQAYCAMAYLYTTGAHDYQRELVALDKSGVLRKYNDTSRVYEDLATFGANSKMLYFTNVNKLVELFIYNRDEAYLYSIKGGKRAFSGGVQAACAYNNRLFMALNPFKLAYTSACNGLTIAETIHDSGNIFHFSEGGAEVVAMANLEDCIYLFFPRAITRLRVKGAPKDFALENVPYEGGEIFGGSVGVFGNRICFLAQDGVYLFDGKQAKKAYQNLTILPKREGQVCEHCIFEDQYLLTYLDENEVKKMLVLDADGESGYFSFAPEAIFDLHGTALYQNILRIYRFKNRGSIPSSEQALFTSEKLNFGGGKTAIHEIVLKGTGTLTLSVEVDGRRSLYTVRFSGGKKRIKTRLFGEEFQFIFQVFSDAKVHEMEVVFEKIGG